MKRIAILISGRGSNMEALLKNSLNAGGKLSGICDPVVVISNKEDASGLDIAAKYGIRTEVVRSKGKDRQSFERELIDTLDKYSPDYIVLAGFMRILTPFFVGRYRRRIINIHPADISEYRGPDGYGWAFKEHKRETTITVHYVDEQVDNGEIVGTRKIDISSAKSLDEIRRIGLKAEHEFYSDVLKNVLGG